MVQRYPPKHPDEVLDYEFDWSGDLEDGETIATRVVTVTGATKDSDEIDGESLRVWLSGGTAGSIITIAVRITTSAGRTLREFGVISYGEPVDLQTAKQHLRIVDDTSEDELIAGYIQAAREWFENHTGHILVQREITQTFDRFAGYLELHQRPIVSVDEIAYTDTDGAAQTVASFVTTGLRYPLRVYPAHSEAWPSTRTNTLVEVTFTAGYAEGEVPQRAVQAILLLVENWFRNRGAVSAGPVNEVPFAVQALADQMRGAWL